MALQPWERSARVYDALYGSMKDYVADARQIHTWIQAYNPGAATLVDVACGTGLHLEHLKQFYDCRGVDLSDSMLAIARDRNPEVTFHQGDMREFDLGELHDAVTCLFSAIGYMPDVASLNRAIANMARHLKPGGVCILEPWLSPEGWLEEHMDLMTVDEPHLKVARMNSSERSGKTAILHMHHLVMTDQGVETYSEDHVTTLFSEAEYRSAFELAGFEVTFDPEGFIGRGMYFGVQKN